MAMVANNNIKDGHNDQQTIRANDYEKMVFNGGGGEGQQWWQWCSMAATMDNNKAVARQQRQRGGRNNQIEMTFEGGGGRGHSTVVTMENGKVTEHSTAVVTDDSKVTVQQDLESATEQEQEADAMLEDKINRRRYRRMGVGGQRAKRRKAGLQFPFSGVYAYCSPERDTTTSQRTRGVRQEEVAVCESIGSRGKQEAGGCDCVCMVSIVFMY
jgi:hypothetical protein